jgi:hypothetical protein
VTSRGSSENSSTRSDVRLRTLSAFTLLEAGRITVFETFEPNERESSALAGILACGQAWRPNERGELVPPWLKIVVVVEELGEAAGSEDDRVDASALRAVGHGHRGAHDRHTTGSS